MQRYRAFGFSFPVSGAWTLHRHVFDAVRYLNQRFVGQPTCASLRSRGGLVRHGAWMAIFALTVGLLQPPQALSAIETDPTVLAIQESDPQSPAAKIRAAKVLINLRRHDLAKDYLQQIVDQQPSQAVLVSIHDQFGPALFVGFAQDPDLRPTGTDLAQQVLDAADAFTKDPERIAQWMTDLASPIEATRFQAIAGLQRAGPLTVGPLLGVLADEDLAAAHRAARTTILALNPAAVMPLIAALEADKPQVRLRAVQLLGLLRDRRAAVSLVGPAFSAAEDPGVQTAALQALQRIVGASPQRWEGEDLLKRHIEQAKSGQLSWTADTQGRVPRWRWDHDAESLTENFVPRDMAQAQLTARLAEDLSLIRPQQHEYWLQATTARLEAAKLEAGWDQPLPASAWSETADDGSGIVEEVLQHALRCGQPAAAIAALEILERVGTVELLAASSSQPRPIVSALKDSNRRVQFAAAQTIMKLGADSRYAGSSHLVETLVHLAMATGERRALVGFPRLERGSEIAGLLEELGFATDLVTNSRHFFRLATQTADYEIAFLSDATNWPDANQLLQSLRTDPHSAGLSVALMARAGNTEMVERVVAQDPLAIAVVEPFSVDAMRLHVGNLLSARGSHYVPPVERLQHAQRALSWLIELAENRERYGFYDVICWEPSLERILFVPELSQDAAQLLGLLGSSAAQRALVDVVSSNALSIERRRAAAAALQTAVDRRGIMLTTDEILTQYERYNASRRMDKETQAVLGAVLDTLESRRLDGKS